MLELNQQPLPGLPGKLPRVGIIIQARMTSTRFPGKSMALLDGKPVIFHVLDRLMPLHVQQFVNETILAVPQEPDSEPMVEAVQANYGYVKIFRGEPHDVLTRYYDAATKYGLDFILRITGDCPFIDPNVCMDVMATGVRGGFDYVSNCHPKRTFPKGLDCEFFTFDALEVAHLNAKLPYQREHVTPYMYNHKHYNRSCVVNKNADHSDQNLCVDLPEDITRIEKILHEARTGNAIKHVN